MDLNIISDQGMPLLIATALYAAIKLFRMPFVQDIIGKISLKLQWSAWPKPLCTAIVFAFAGLGALIPALQQGTPWTKALIVAITAGLGAMGFDAAHGSIKEPLSTNAVNLANPPDLSTPHDPAASLKIPMPVIVLALLFGSMSCAHYQAHARQPFAAAPEALSTPSIVITDSQCSAWLSQQNACQIASASLSVIGGGSGLAAAFPDQASHRDLLGGIGLGLSAVGAGLQVWCHNLSVDLEQFCSISPAPVTP